MTLSQIGFASLLALLVVIATEFRGTRCVPSMQRGTQKVQ